MKKTNNTLVINNANIQLSSKKPSSKKNVKKSKTVSVVDLKKQVKTLSKMFSTKLNKQSDSNIKLKSIPLSNKKETSLKKVIKKSSTPIYNLKDVSLKNYINSYKKILKNSKSSSKKYILKGGGNVITESLGMIKTMKALGNSIFKEIHDITRIGHDINNVASSDPLPNENTKTTNVQTPDL